MYKIPYILAFVTVAMEITALHFVFIGAKWHFDITGEIPAFIQLYLLLVTGPMLLDLVFTFLMFRLDNVNYGGLMLVIHVTNAVLCNVAGIVLLSPLSIVATPTIQTMICVGGVFTNIAGCCSITNALIVNDKAAPVFFRARV